MLVSTTEIDMNAAAQTLRETALTRATALVGSTCWSHKGRGPSMPQYPDYLSLDWVGLMREAVKAATNEADLADLTDYTPESITVEQAEDLMLAWGLRRIPVREAREGDFLVVEAKNYGKPEVFGAIISQHNAGTEKANRKPYGMMVTARHCRPTSRFYLMADVREKASAFRLG